MKPAKLVMFPSHKYPITITLYSRTGVELWSRVVEEPDGLAAIEVPGFRGTGHTPVRCVVVYADGTSEVG